MHGDLDLIDQLRFHVQMPLSFIVPSNQAYWTVDSIVLTSPQSRNHRNDQCATYMTLVTPTTLQLGRVLSKIEAFEALL